MKNLFTLSLFTFKLAYKKGVILGLSLYAAILVVIFFNLGASSGVLIEEYPVRMQYALWGLFSLLAPAILWTTALSLRSDYQGQQLQMMSTLPVSRKKQWMARWIGGTAACLIPVLIALCVLHITAYFYIGSYSENAQKDFHARFDTPRCTVYPIRPNVESFVDAEYEKILKTTTLNSEDERQALRQMIREKHTLQSRSMGENGTISIPFDTRELPEHAPLFLEINYRAQDRVTPSLSSFTLVDNSGVSYGTDTLKTNPFYGKIIPVPENANRHAETWLLKIKGIKAQSMIFESPYEPTLFYPSAFPYMNMILLIAGSLCWTAAFVALALTASTLFPFTISAFVLGCAWIIGMMTPFLMDILKDMQSQYIQSVGDQIWSGFLIITASVMQTFSTPPGIEQFAVAQSMTTDTVLPWFIGTILFLIIFAFIGSLLLQQREVFSDGNGGDV